MVKYLFPILQQYWQNVNNAIFGKFQTNISNTGQNIPQCGPRYIQYKQFWPIHCFTTIEINLICALNNSTFVQETLKLIIVKVYIREHQCLDSSL